MPPPLRITTKSQVPKYINGLKHFWEKEINTKFKPQIEITKKAVELAEKVVDAACCKWWNPFTW